MRKKLKCILDKHNKTNSVPKKFCKKTLDQIAISIEEKTSVITFA